MEASGRGPRKVHSRGAVLAFPFGAILVIQVSIFVLWGATLLSLESVLITENILRNRRILFIVTQEYFWASFGQGCLTPLVFGGNFALFGIRFGYKKHPPQPEDTFYRHSGILLDIIWAGVSDTPGLWDPLGLQPPVFPKKMYPAGISTRTLCPFGCQESVFNQNPLPFRFAPNVLMSGMCT